ncbi:MAG: bac 5 protein [Acidobacteriota bacterium]|nr:bac 5 protein [Acidobacteriota bacterium]
MFVFVAIRSFVRGTYFNRCAYTSFYTILASKGYIFLCFLLQCLSLVKSKKTTRSNSMRKNIGNCICFGLLGAMLFMFVHPMPIYSLSPVPTPVEEKETLRIGISNFPASLNPFYAMDETSQAVLNKVFDALFYFDGAGKLQNGLVQDFHQGKNNKEIILSLKKNIFFSNGRELEAEDVTATLERIKDSRFNSPYSDKLAFINRVEKVDKYTVKLILNYLPTPWRNYLCIKILNAGEIAGVDPVTFRNKVLSGTGAYQIQQVNEPSEVLLSLKDANKNPAMYRSIEYIVVSYTHLTPLKLLSNEIDICELQPEHHDAYNNLKEWQQKFTILKYKKFGYTFLVFNLNNVKLDREVRRILYNLLIHGDFVERFLNGKGECIFSPFLLLNGKVKLAQFPVQPLVKPLQLKILGNSESKIRKEFILFLQAELKPYNIYLSPLFLEYHTFLEYIRKSAYDLAVSGYVLDLDNDMKDIFYSDAYFNYAHFKSPEMDRLLDQGLLELDPVKRETIYLKAHDIWLEELPFIPVFTLYYYMGVSRKIKIPGTVSTLVGSESDFLIDIRQWTK